ncbi:MAG: RidA family protein, partial [Actinomycetota bacterium]
RINPRTIHPPAAKYAHGVLSRGFDQILHSSGVVPVDVEGNTPENIGDQATLVWKNIEEILKEAHMGITDIVSVTTYVVLGQDLQEIMKVRDDHLKRHRAASTLVTVPELAQEQWKMEISIIAVK